MSLLNLEVNDLVVFNFAVAMVVVLASAGAVLKRFRLDLMGRMDGVKWDFSTSWGTNLTTLGAIATTVLAAVVSEESTTEATSADVGAVNLTSAEYQGLSLLFAVAVIVSPFLYNAVRTTRRSGEGVEVRGYVGLFLVSSVLTLSAVLGQLWLVGLLTDDLGA